VKVDEPPAQIVCVPAMLGDGASTVTVLVTDAAVHPTVLGTE